MKIAIVLEYLDGTKKSGMVDYDRICDVCIVTHNGRYFTYTSRPHSPITFSEVDQPYELYDFEPVATHE